MELTTFFLSALVALELCIVIIGLFSQLHGRLGNIYLAFSVSVISTLSIYSALIQTLLLCGIQSLLPLFEVLFVLLALFYCSKDIFRNARNELGNYDYYYLGLVAFICIILIQSAVIPTLNHDCLVYNIARTSLMNAESRLYVNEYNSFRQVMFSVGFDVLSLLFSRFNSDYFLGFINFLLFLSVISSVIYLLMMLKVRPRYWIVSLAIMFSNSSSILQASSAKNDMVLVACAMASLAILLALIRGNLDLYAGLAFLFMFSVYGFSAKITYAMFMAPFGLMALCYIVSEWKSLNKHRFETVSVPGIIIFLGVIHVCLLVVFFHNNYSTYGNILGIKWFADIHRNHDGLSGMLANVLRFAFSLLACSGGNVKDFLIFLHDDTFALGMKGTDNAFSGVYDEMIVNNEDEAGVGIFYTSALLLAPLLFILAKEKFAKLLLAVSVGTYLMLCYALSWNIWVVRFIPLAVMPITPVFALLAQRFKLKSSVCVIVLVAYASAFITINNNGNKNFGKIIKAVIDVDKFYDRYNPYIMNSASLFRGLKGNLLIICESNDPIYQYFVLAKSAKIKIFSAEYYCIPERNLDFADYVKNHRINYILNMSTMCEFKELSSYALEAFGTTKNVQLYRVPDFITESYK